MGGGFHLLNNLVFWGQMELKVSEASSLDLIIIFDWRYLHLSIFLLENAYGSNEVIQLLKIDFQRWRGTDY